MKTLQDWLSEDRERFLHRLEGNHSIEEIENMCEEELHRILSQYNDQNIADAQRQQAQYLLEMVHLSFPFMNCIADIQIYEKTQFGNKEKDGKQGSKGLLWVGLGLLIVSLVVLVVLTGSMWKGPQILIGIVLNGIAVLLLYLAGRSVYAKKKDVDLETEIKIDAQKVYHTLSAALTRCDVMLQEMVRQKTIPDTKVQEEVPVSLLRYFSDMLETAYTEKDSSLSRELISQADYYLHQNGISVVEDSSTHPEWFDSMPGKQAVLRPALVKDDKVLQRGLAAGVRK